MARREYSPAVAATAGWLVPGLGHMYLGQWRRGAFVMAALLVTFFAGAALGHFQNVWWTGERWLYVACQVWAGGPAVGCFAWAAWAEDAARSSGPADEKMWPDTAPATVTPKVFNQWAEMGALCTQVVGLLNLFVFTDAGVRAWRLNRTGKEGK